MHINHHSARVSRGSVMRTFIGTMAAAMLVAGAASAASSPASINVGGTAAAVCSLPSTFTFSNNTGGDAGTFSGTVWQIPSNSIANANGAPVGGSEIAVRITGPGFCNTPHKIEVSSENGALRRDGMTTAPAGFAIKRPVKYDAHWADGSQSSFARRYGPGVFDWTPPAEHSGTWVEWRPNGVVSLPGARPFDVRLAVLRGDGVTAPLVAGAYSDTVTITLTPLS